MAFLDWSSGYSVGVAEIDSQHKKLIDMINSLHSAMTENKGADVSKKIVFDIVAYTQTHFECEENYMRKFNYQGYPSHKKEHDEFAQKAISLKERVEGKGFVLSLEILNMLKAWLQGHIMGTDKKYTQCFNENGLK